MGMENLLMAIVAEPELVTALVDMSVDINLKLAKEIVAGARSSSIRATTSQQHRSADVAAPFPQAFLSRVVRVMQGYKELGLYVIKHTDGNLWPIIDMIVDSGIDCLDPIDPQAGWTWERSRQSTATGLR